MRIGYTEFSFGYAFTENLIRSLVSKPKGAPYFPNLIQEAKLGYDIHIDLPGCPLFFQYKLPDLMVKGTAAEIAKYHLPGIQVPFFRMPLMRRDVSRQHELLMDLEKSFPQKVLYATPCLPNVTSFNTDYNAANVHRRSVFFSPRDIGPLPDNRSHIVAYRDGLTHGYMCSEPKKVAARSFEVVEETALKSFGQRRFHALGQVSEELKSNILELVPAQLRQSEGQIRERIQARKLSVVDQLPVPQKVEKVADDLLVSRELARVGLGVDVLIAQPAKEVESVQEQ